MQLTFHSFTGRVPANASATTPLERAISIAGGVAMLAEKLGVAASAPSMWKARGSVPAERCPAIERLTAGAVRCEELRPDVEWAVLRSQPADGNGQAEQGLRQFAQEAG